MKQQLKLFQVKDGPPENISKLIRSREFHADGMELAKAHNYNRAKLLIDLIYYHLQGVDIEAWIESSNPYCYHLAEFKIDKTDCFLSELECNGFYLTLAHGEIKKVDLLIYEWHDSKWGDFDLARLTEKEIRKNIGSISDVLNNVI